MTPRRINSDGRKLIQSFESLRLAAYHGAADRPGLYTIGWGHTGMVDGRPVAPGMKITEAQANALLEADLQGFEEAVERLVPGTADCEFAAMVSLCFNIGTRGFQGSSVRRLHLAGDLTGAANAFRLWCKAGRPPKKVAGLVRRREAERSLYLSGRAK